MPDSKISADYLVVGAGAAGCALAARLSEDPDCSVLLIEAGGRDWNPLLGVPLMTGLILRSAYSNWSYVTEPEPYLNDRRLQWARGRILGGSTSINGMVYMRGLPRDFDRWAAEGLPGWSYADVLPYFLRSENSFRGASAFHGKGGPLHVSAGRLENPLFQVYLEAATQAGHPRTDDFGGPHPHGAGCYDFTIRHGRRVSSSTAFLHGAMARPNLRVVTHAQVLQLHWGPGRLVNGVEILQRGQRKRLHATREVLLCGGAVNSPQLLMLSGIGPADALRAHQVPVRVDLPGVGQGMQDHLLVRVDQEGPACHTNRRSCFYTAIRAGDEVVISDPMC